MKVKEAVELIKSQHQNTPIEEVTLATLYHDELMKRSNERWRSGKIPMPGFCGLLKEVNEWIIKVCIGLNMTQGRARWLMNEFNKQAYESAQASLQHTYYKKEREKGGEHA